MDVNLRLAVIEDVPEILDIVNYEIAHTTSNYNYDPQTLEEQEQWFFDKQKSGYPIFVAVLDNLVVGFSTYGKFREKAGYRFTVEHSVYVKSGFIGKGIGKLLLAQLIKTAREQGFHTMIGGIDASNLQSIAFHEKFGFESCGIIRQAGFKFDKWLDLLFMQLILN